MPQNVIISFSNPLLQPGEKFRISYENIGTGVVVNLPDKTDNSDLTLVLDEGTFRFTIRLIKSTGDICPPTTIDYTVFPPPTEPVDPGDPDPPVTTDTPCYCYSISNVKIKEDCNGLMTLSMNITYPATNQSCITKIWVRYAASGPGSTPVLSSFNGQPAAVSIPLSSINFVQYRAGLYCCSDNTEGGCVDWATVTNKEGCSCDPGGISLLNTVNTSGTTSQLTINISSSVPSLPPYLVTITGGTNTFSQSFNSSGQHLFNVPFYYESAVLKVSNTCGSSQINITNQRCKNGPAIISVVRNFANNTITVKWYGDSLGNYTVQLFQKNDFSIPVYSDVVTPQPSNLVNEKVFFVSIPFINSQLINAKVFDNCGTSTMDNSL